MRSQNKLPIDRGISEIQEWSLADLTPLAQQPTHSF